MGTYIKEWDCCGSVTSTEAWEPEVCPFCVQPDAADARRYRYLRTIDENYMEKNRMLELSKWHGPRLDEEIDLVMKELK